MALIVNEIFTSFQGEGAFIGRKSLFIRLQGCNLACSWCDSKYSVSKQGGIELSFQEMLNYYIKGEFNNVVITGGEPLIQQHDPEFNKMIDYFISADKTIEIETNGTIIPDFPGKDTVMFNVSPKLENSGMGEHFSYEALKWFADNYQHFKFVVDPYDENCLGEIYALQDEFKIEDAEIYLMAEGVTKEEVTKGTIELMQMDHPFNVTTRAHILFNVK